MFNIQENLKKLPELPGVYIHKDKLGQVIYVGKAISLKNRVRQYFQSSKNMDAKVKAMVGHIAEFEYITCGSEMEAFILECNLIKKYRPKYNILLRDDKTYPYIKVTTTEEYPRILKTRLMDNKGDKYFGPYSDAGAVNQMIDLLNNIYKLKRCSALTFPKKFKPCLNYHIKLCDGICTGKVNKEDYLKRVELVLDYLKGKNKKITTFLKEKMKTASENMLYEQAALYRDYLKAAEALAEKQRVVLKSGKDMDVVISAGKEHVVLFFVRDGKLSGRETFTLQMEVEDQDCDVISAFIKLHYGEQTTGPSEIIVSKLPEEKGIIEEYLSSIWKRKLSITAPQKGEKKALLDLAKRDVFEMNKTINEKEQNKIERREALGGQMHSMISLVKDLGKYAGKEYRVEAFDISNTNGVDTVGAMVVFVGMKPDRKAYRRFKVKTIDGQDDYGGMQEIIYRRFKRAEAGDPGFSQLPDALLIDGGKGHVTAVQKILDAMKIKIPVFGMAKDDKHRTRALVYSKDGEFQQEILKKYPLLFKYIGTIQEEVHRFAIDYHRGLRNKNAIHSVLDEISGVGETRRNSLLSYFGSVEKIKQASEDKLMEADGITKKVAQAIVKYFHC